MSCPFEPHEQLTAWAVRKERIDSSYMPLRETAGGAAHQELIACAKSAHKHGTAGADRKQLMSAHLHYVGTSKTSSMHVTGRTVQRQLVCFQYVSHGQLAVGAVLV